MAVEVYRIKNSIEEDRPEIDFQLPVNGKEVDWLVAADVLDSVRDAVDWPKIAVLVDHPSATEWDCYSVPGTLDMWSQRAIDAMGSALRDFQLFPGTLNDKPYYFLSCRRPLDCFDREKSVWRPIPGTTDRVMEIKKHAFFLDRIADPLVFCIPDVHNKLFATRSVIECLLHACCRGIDMQKLT